jgi:hypothetical protein
MTGPPLWLQQWLTFVEALAFCIAIYAASMLTLGLGMLVIFEWMWARKPVDPRRLLKCPTCFWAAGVPASWVAQVARCPCCGSETKLDESVA